MSKILTLELNDQAFAAILSQAASIGIPPESLAASLLEQRLDQPVLSPTSIEERRAKFEQHFGSLSLGNSADLENENIDAELARDYASTHEKI
jgi:hypothetical protein